MHAGNRWKRKGAIVIGAVGLGALGLMAGLWLWPVGDGGTDGGDATLVRDPERAAIQATLAGLPAHHLQRTAPGHYALTFDLTLDEVAGATTSRHAAKVTAELDLDLPRSQAAAGWVAGRIGKVKVAGDPALADLFGAKQGRPDPGARPFALRTDKTGAVVERRFAPTVPVTLRNVLSNVAGGIQVVGAPHAKAKAWQSLEDHSGATIAMTYEAEPDGTLRKRWHRGTADSAPNGPKGEGESTLEFDAAGLAAAHYAYQMAINLTLHKSFPQKRDVKADIALVRVPGGDAKWADLIDVTGLPSEAQLAIAEAKPDMPLPPTARTPSAILAASQAAYAARDRRAVEAATRELRTNLDHDPTALPAFLVQLRQPGHDGNAVRTLAEALAFADSAACRRAYAAAIADPKVPYVTRHSLVSAASFVPDPDADLIAGLRTLAENNGHELQTPAALAWGAQARLQGGRHPDLGTRLAAGLIARAKPWLSSADGDKRPNVGQLDETGLWLEALGNLGGEQTWPLVQPWLVVKSDRLRYLAVDALRFVPVQEAREALALAMQKDPWPRNRRRAAEVAQYHPQAVMQESVQRALKEDGDAGVRIGAAGTLAVWSVTSPGLLDDLKEAEKRERNPKVRAILGQLQPVSLDVANGAKPGEAKPVLESVP